MSACGIQAESTNCLWLGVVECFSGQSFLSLKPMSYWPGLGADSWDFLSVSLINVCKRKRRSSFSFRFILISRDVSAGCAW